MALMPSNGLIQLVYPVKAPGQHCFEAYGAYRPPSPRPVFPRAEVGRKSAMPEE
ncbi:MAG: hypothetical protein ACLUEK_07400 [Oscillospiraceae bacterium]